jgi:hypothetical protein
MMDAEEVAENVLRANFVMGESVRLNLLVLLIALENNAEMMDAEEVAGHVMVLLIGVIVTDAVLSDYFAVRY